MGDMPPSQMSGRRRPGGSLTSIRLLAGWAGSPAAAEEALRAAGVEPGARGESLRVEEFAAIAAARATLRR